MQSSLFLLNKLRERFFRQNLSNFDLPISQNILNIEDKKRSNIFTWRGQFSPQLIESLLLAYCPRNAIVLDPFVGSGTVLNEAACFGLQAFGCEVNPAAWILSKTYELVNLKVDKRKEIINSVTDKIETYFLKSNVFDISAAQKIDILSFSKSIYGIYSCTDNFEKIIINTLVVLLDLGNNNLTTNRICDTFFSLCQVINNLPYSDSSLMTSLCDARNLPFKEDFIDFIVTSPPYINVFNYHQNYRRSAEALGWDLLKIAKSEIGSIELDLIFDSPDNFLYHQKGQLKLDNTILEEFLPQLIYRSLRSIDDSFEIGPKSTFAGLSFLSSLGNPGQGGEPTLRTKNQDFVLGKKLYLKTAFDREFTNSKLVESHLGYICAECKTNLDKTMFQEAVATSRDLKIAVPSSLYFLVCEFLDMTPVSITSTQIDDVLIVRKSRRMSANIRQEYRTPESRKNYRQEYADFIDASKYYADVFQRMIDKVKTLVDDTTPRVEQVLERGHF
jgi:hypothetical protein